MLRYKFNIKTSNAWGNIDCGDSIIVASDGSYIQGKTDGHNVYDGQNVKVAILRSDDDEFNPKDWSDYVIKAKHVKEQGYINVDKIFPVTKDDKWYSFQFINGKYYVWEDSTSLDLGLSWATFKSTNSTSITVTIKYYVYNSVVTVDGKDYEVDFSLVSWMGDGSRFTCSTDAISPLYVTIDNRRYNIINGLPPQWKDVTLFTVSREDNVKLSFDEVHSANKTYSYPLDAETLLVFDHGKAPIFKNGIYYRVNMTSSTYYIETSLTSDFEETEVLTDFNAGHLYVDYKDAPYGDYINLYVKNVKHVINEGSTIMVKCPQWGHGELMVMRDYTEGQHGFYVDINGHRFYNSSNNTKNYIEYEGELLPLYNNTLKGNTSSLTKDWKYFYYIPNSTTPTYTNTCKSYPYITINGKDYPIFNSEDRFPYINYDNTFEYELKVVRSINNNAISCSVAGESSDGIAKFLATNYKDCVFELVLPMLPKWLYSKPTLNYTSEGLPFRELNIFTALESLNVPISLENSVSQNLNQNELIDTYFTNVELSKKVNDIVDMERDVYYPAYMEQGKFHLLNGIQYHLHFRERDESWKIKDGGYWSTLTNNTNGTTNGYWQPSDLLGYLGFTNNDVFYQKKKLSKSFLRMSYFDSKDAKKQSLLYTATSFLNKNLLYKRYIDNSQINKSKTWTSGDKSQHYISVDAEPESKNPEERLDCTFYLQNRYETSMSSEGFYLYLFRDLTSPHKPKRIYLRTNFSHAGYGQTLTFICPRQQGKKTVYNNESICKCGDIITDKQIIPLDIFRNKEEMIDGYPLKELYSYMHLPINIMYCEDIGQYIYFLDEEFTNTSVDENGILHINLYELKIKDESTYNS